MMPMIKMMTVKDATAVREKKSSSGMFFFGDMANERTFCFLEIQIAIHTLP